MEACCYLAETSSFFQYFTTVYLEINYIFAILLASSAADIDSAVSNAAIFSLVRDDSFAYRQPCKCKLVDISRSMNNEVLITVWQL